MKTIALTTALAAAVVIAPAAANSAEDAVYVVGHAIIAPSGQASTAAAAAGTADTSCSDTAYALSSWKMPTTFTWYYNGTNAPATVAGTALATLQTATETVVTGANRCGLPRITGLTQKYAGTSTAKAQVSSTATCTGNDGKSVTSWGALPAGYLAYTCTYYRANGQVLASDMLIDNVANTWFTTMPAGCTRAFDLQTTLTHERLHTAGLSHVSQAANPAQVMTPSSAPCDTTRRLLAAGDYTGLKTLTNR